MVSLENESEILFLCSRGNAVKDHDRRRHADRGRQQSFASKNLTSVMSGPTLDSVNQETHKGKYMDDNGTYLGNIYGIYKERNILR